MHQPSFPAGLIDSLATGQCVIVVGSGVSASSLDNEGNSPPTWKQLLEAMVAIVTGAEKAEIQKLINNDDYLTAAELIYGAIGSRIFDVLERFFSRRYLPNENHKKLAQLAQQVYVTPNFDTIFDTFARNEFSSGVSVKSQTQGDILPWIRGRNILIIKNHGTIDDRATIVFTRSQYARERVINAKFFRVVDALFLTRTVLFVGCGFSDPDFQLMMEDTTLMFPGAPHHYMIKLHSEESIHTDKAISELRNLRLIYYKDNHDQLPVLLDELCVEVDARRRALSVPAF